MYFISLSFTSTISFILDISSNRDPSTGKRIRKFKSGFRTKKEGTAYVNSLSVDISNGLNIMDNKITWDTYSHVLPSMKKHAADLLNNVFDDL
ncbi:MAG: Arm DNA-binding domain-containing protein [Clostridium sp.]|uniref:Arm DNA-binding domain-containing protein n=1 Tax=Clostridium sp. TaxID=1506 RepID=UPI0025BFA1C3|nr:Arm DNA-binding domain-containing protein [Clostridium sp.]MCE5221319.1 Arm DNA-binding domain-containing protein [Clostridium sp.]